MIIRESFFFPAPAVLLSGANTKLDKAAQDKQPIERRLTGEPAKRLLQQFCRCR